MPHLIVVIVRKLGYQIVADQDARLKGPGTRDVAHGVTTTAENQCRQIKAFDKVDAVGMPAHAQVEAAQTVTRQTVSTALQDHGLWTIPFHHTLDHRLKNALVRDIVDTIPEGEVDRIIFALANTDVAELASAGEVLAVLVEGNGHDAICGVKRFFDTITMVNINVDVKHSLFEAQKFENSQDDICDLLVRQTKFAE